MRSVLPAGTAVLAALAALTVGCSSSTNNPGAAGSGPSASATTPTAVTGASTGSPSAAPSQQQTDTGTPAPPAATEFNPPGDIPDNAVYVDHTAPGSHVHFTVPEGWAQTTNGAVTTFTDKYNSIGIEVRPRAAAPTEASAKAEDVPELQGTVAKFELQRIDTVQRQHGSAIHITFLMDSAPNPVTDKVVRDTVERFEFWHNGEEAILTLSGPQNADNVDPWQIVSDSLEWK
ncbi:MAG: hypothetical protein QOD98_1858 [Nocardioidaceae bacterium]|jgi:hypothetical protein|nr:hypothetical protein [Nocardioidaceae bacterium]